jgi:hypothetical protein
MGSEGVAEKDSVIIVMMATETGGCGARIVR